MREERIDSSEEKEIYAVSLLESSISRIVLLIVALGALSYLPIAGLAKVPLAALPLYALSLLAAAQVIALAAIEKKVRLPRSTLTVPAVAFFLVLVFSSLSSWPPFGRIGGSASLGESVIHAFMAYLGYIFMDSRRERRKLLVLVSFSLTAIFIVDLIRMAIAAFGVPAVGKAEPMVRSAEEAGLYLSFIVPLIAAQVFERRSWMSRYSFLPALIGGLIYSTAAAPLTIIAALTGLATLFLLSRRSLVFTALPFLLAIALSAAILAGSGPFRGTRPIAFIGSKPKPEAPIGGKAASKAESLVAKLFPDDRNGLGTAPTLLLLVFLAAFLIQSAPRISEIADYEKAFHLGVIAGLGGYAVFSVAYGNSAAASPTVWLMVGAAARLVNPTDEPIIKLGFRKNSKR